MKNNDLHNLLEPHRKRLLHLARGILGAHSAAEDAVQDAFLKFIQHAPSDLRSAEAWLTTLVRHLAIDQYRQQRVKHHQHGEAAVIDTITGFDSWVTEMTDSATAQAAELNIDAAAALRVMTNYLAPHEVAAVLLREVFDADYDEIAAAIGKQEATCRQLVHRALKRTREHVREGGGEHKRKNANDDDADKDLLFLYCWQSLASRNASMLFAVLAEPQTTCAAMSIAQTLSQAMPANAESTKVSLQFVNGRFAIVLMLGNVVLCAVPVGPDATACVML
jgi:RNA polymerase sigma factor (sigma-70 family)